MSNVTADASAALLNLVQAHDSLDERLTKAVRVLTELFELSGHEEGEDDGQRAIRENVWAGVREVLLTEVRHSAVAHLLKESKDR